MRRGLRVVGDVPEFADAPSRVEVLEKRVETLAKPELVSALAASDTARAEGDARRFTRLGKDSNRVLGVRGDARGRAPAAGVESV